VIRINGLQDGIVMRHFVFSNRSRTLLKDKIQYMLSKFIKGNLDSINIMNATINDNLSKLTRSLLLLPLFLLLTIVSFLFSQDALNIDQYVAIQKIFFLFINAELSQFPATIYNLTQMGDSLIFLSFLTLFIVYAPKIWESLISASLVSAIFSNVLKSIFSVPRPAAMFDNNSFVIIGKALSGHNSLPSGHSITVFTILTVLLFAFMPKKLNYKILWGLGITVIGLLLVFTRVGVGAHYPLDVTVGSIVGYISGIAGILISRKYRIWNWMSNKKYYPIFIALLIICCISLVKKISHESLIIFYFSLTSLIVSLYKITYVYIKR
jgi:membrane-associated phospholipid phosphatase